jgi:hypothetical protein
VKEECPNIAKLSQVENFVYLLCLSYLPGIDRLGCLVQEPIEKDDENFKGFVSGYSWQLGLKWGKISHYWDTLGSIFMKEYSLMWKL